MRPYVSLVTLGVADLGRAKRFYEALGWAGQEVDETVFFPAGRLVVVLWDREKLAADAGVEPSPGPTSGGVVFAHNVGSDDEVRAVMAASAAAGGRVTRPPAPTFYGGFAGCFADPDGHLWEVAHNPGFGLRDDGSVELPEFGAAG